MQAAATDWASGLARVDDLLDAFVDVLRPPPARTADVWAEANRVLPPNASAPGPFRCDRAPYTIEPQRAMSDPSVLGVVMITAAQSGKTDVSLNVIGHRADDSPTPILYVGPSKPFCEREYSPRLTAMLQSTPALWAKVSKGKKDTKTQKLVSGMPIRLAWAGSAKQLVGFSAGLAVFDERDQADQNLQGQGDPFEMVRARGRTFPGFRWLVTSTITTGLVDTFVHPESGLEHWEVAELDDVESPTWRLWQQGTRHEFALPCAGCGEYFIPRLRLLMWPEKATPDAAAASAWLACPRCAFANTDAHRPEMLARGRYVSPGQRLTVAGEVIGEGVRSSIRSYWVSGLASFSSSFGELARAWLEAARLSGDVQGVKNLSFAELYARAGRRGDSPAWLEIRERAEPYELMTIPAGVLLISCGVDTQDNRLAVVVRGFGRDQQSWLIYWGELFGDPAYDEVWQRLDEILFRTWRHPLGGEMQVACTAVDSGGHRTQAVYNYVRSRGPNVIATKGLTKPGLPIITGRPTDQDVAYNGRFVRGGVSLWGVGSDTAKAEVYARLKIEAPGPRYMHFPHGLDDTFYEGLTAERLRTRHVRGRPMQEWFLPPHKRNEPLDCEALALAAAVRAGLFRADWDALEEALSEREPAPSERSGWSTIGRMA